MNEQDTIYKFIEDEMTSYKTTPVNVIEGYDWSMYEHIQRTTMYLNSVYLKGANDGSRPFKNIVLPIMNLHYRAEGFDVKDIQLYVNDIEKQGKSFILRKYHDKWANENELDTFIDDMVESYCAFGGALIKNVNDVKPEVVPLQRLAFCDQTDLLSGVICEKHEYTPAQLKEMKGWGDESNGATATIDELITLSKNQRSVKQDKNGMEVKTPGRYITIYEVHGELPASYLGEDEDKYFSQMHIVSLLTDTNGDTRGITLFRGKERTSPYDAIIRDKIYGRALGRGGVEELFDPQTWMNYDIQRINGMLDAASKVIHVTNDKLFAKRNNINRLDNNSILYLEEGKTVGQMNTTPVNITLFERSLADWENHAAKIGSANESIMGEQPSSGTPFALQQLVTAEAHSLHEYRKGKLSTGLARIYRKWIIPHLAKEILSGDTFVADLSQDEMQEIMENVVTNEAKKEVKEMILSGESITEEEVLTIKDKIRTNFAKGGKRRFLDIMKDEFKSAPLDVKVNIAGKQKYLPQMVEKLTNVFRQILMAPQVLDDPRMSKIFNQILEYSGMESIDFYQPMKPQPQQIQQPGQPQQQVNQPAPVQSAQPMMQ